MLTQLAFLSAAQAYVQVDFSISNKRPTLDTDFAHDTLFKRHAEHHSPLNSSLETGSGDNSTVEPVINASLTTSYNFYYGTLLVGEPAQELDVLLDTGSPISWFYGPEGSYNNATQFFPNMSSTFTSVNYSFSAAYGSGQYLGTWGQDRVAAPQFVARNTTFNATNNTYTCSQLSGVQEKRRRKSKSSSVASSTSTSTSTSISAHPSGFHNQTTCDTRNFSVPLQFGIISDFVTSAGAPGLLGLGPHIQSAGPSTYKSLPEAYYQQNITSSSAFSVFLEKTTGRFLFGGVDLRYAQLPLYRFPQRTSLVASPSSSSTSWTIFLDSLSLNNSAKYTVSSRVTLDTGSPISLLPPGFVNAVGQQLGLTKYGKYETWYINGTTIPRGNISFYFGGLKIDADISNFLVPGEYVWLDDGPQNVTALALMGASNYLLGDAFFRSSYTVLDPATGDVFVGRRSSTLMNATNSTNASSVVPFASLLKNSTAVQNSSALLGNQTVTSTTIEYVTIRTPVAVNANQYLGTVPGDKADSMTATRSSASATSSSTESSTASSTASSSTSSAKKNGASTLAVPFFLVPLLFI